jgi:hypothetical protein
MIKTNIPRDEEMTERVSIPNETYRKMQESYRRQGVFGDPVWSEPIPFPMPIEPYREPWRHRTSRWIGDKLLDLGCWFHGIDREDLYL